MANFLYRFIERASTYIGEILALSYFNEMFNTYNVDLPLDTEKKVAYFFPKEIVDDVGGVTDSALIGIANANGEFDELSGIGVPNGGEIVNVTVGNETFEAVLFSPIPLGGIMFLFDNTNYNTKTVFYNYLNSRVSGLTSISDITNFSVNNNAVYFDLIPDLIINSNSFQNDNELLQLVDNVGKFTDIGDAGFSGSSLRRITMPSCVNIGHFAFDDCENLLDVTFPNLMDLRSYAFRNCIGLTSISLPLCTSIGEYVFQNCSASTSFQINNITTIPNSAFKGCTSCTSFSFANVLTVGYNAFSGCTSATTFSFAVGKEFGDKCFDTCTSAVNFNMPNLELAGDRCFYNCSSVVLFDFPKINSAGKECFMSCSSCTNVNLFAVLASPYIGLIDDYCFADCTALKTVVMPYAATINKNAFEGCTSLEKADLYGTLTLGDFVFKNCTSLTKVDISNIFSACGSTIGNDGVFLGCNLSTMTIYINTTILTDADITDAQAGGANIVV